jgi:nitroreductase
MTGGLDSDTVRVAVGLATRAPSVRNSQPWQWTRNGRTLRLYAGRDRQVRETDPDGCDLLLSCGAALHHVRMAFASLGWRTRVRRLPDPAEPNLLAVLELFRGRPVEDELVLAEAIPKRNSDRRRYAATGVSATDLAALMARSEASRVVVRAAHEPTGRKDLVRAIADTERMRLAGHAYLLELVAWESDREDQRAVVSEDLEPALVVLGTVEDDRMARLRAGEAASELLLAATSDGLATCLLTDPLGLSDIRQVLGARLLGGAHPQVVLRVGRAQAGAAPLPASPRRNLDEVLYDYGDGLHEMST